MNIRTFGSVDERSLKQLERCMEAGDAEFGVGVAVEEAEQFLYSTVHGAGRVMSRSQARAGSARRKRWACRNRDCPRPSIS